MRYMKLKFCGEAYVPATPVGFSIKAHSFFFLKLGTVQ